MGLGGGFGIGVEGAGEVVFEEGAGGGVGSVAVEEGGDGVAAEGEFEQVGIETGDAGVHRIVGLQGDGEADDNGGLARGELEVGPRASFVGGGELRVRGQASTGVEEADVVQVMVLQPAVDAGVQRDDAIVSGYISAVIMGWVRKEALPVYQ